MTQDVIQMRLPLKAEYLPVLRAAVGVIAGGMEFTYDEVLQLRVAVSEVFDLAAGASATGSNNNGARELDVRFVPGPDRLQVEVRALAPDGVALDPDEESRALLASLMDSVEFGRDGATVHLTKNRPAGHQQ
jgi:anti-sigma regulatory factor (Ser/Thr protein kinase)